MPAGRESECTIDVVDIICDAIADGLTMERAAECAGISVTTIYNWKKRGEKGEEPYEEFLQAIKGAEVEAERALLKELRPGQQGWQAKAWLLERRHPERWRATNKLEHTGPEGGPIVFSKIECEIVDPDEDA